MRIRKHQIVTLAALAAAAGTIVVLWNYTSIVSQQVSRRFTDNLLREHGYQLEMDAVRGSARGEILLLHPRISTVGDSSRVILRADAVRIGVRQLRALFEGRVTIATLRIERPRIEWSPGMLAAGKPADPTVPRRFPRLAIDALEIVDARITRAGARPDELLADHVDLRARIDAKPEQLHVVIESGRAVLSADSLEVKALRAEAIVEGDSLRVENLQVQTGASELEIKAGVALGTGMVHAVVQARPMDLGELARFVPAVRSRGRVQGSARVVGTAREAHLEGTVGGTIDRWTLTGVAVDATAAPGHVVVRRAHGTVNGCSLDARLETHGEAWSGRVQLENVDLHGIDSLATAALPPHQLNGTVDFQRQGPTDSLRLEVNLAASRFGTLPIDRVRGRVVVLGTAVRVQGAEVESPLGNLRTDGRADAQTVDATFDLETTALDGVLAAIGRSGIAGGLAGDWTAQGRVFGPRQALRLEADSKFATWTLRGATASHGTLAAWGRDLGPHAAFDLELRVDSLLAGGHALRDLSADMSWANEMLHITRSQVTAGDTLVAAAASVQPLKRDWAGTAGASTRVRLETALVRLGATEIRVEDPGTIWWRQGAVRVDSLHFVTRGGTLGLDGTADWQARTVDARAKFEAVDFVLLRELARAHWPVQGAASGFVTARGSLDRTQLDAVLDVREGRWDSLALDSLHVVIASDDAGIALRSLRVATPFGRLAATARLGALPALGLAWDRAHPGALRDRLAGATLVATIRADSVDVARWAALGRPAALPRWGGKISTVITADGTLSKPHLHATGGAEQVHVGPRDIGAITYTLDYAGDKLAVRDMEVRNGNQVATIHGMVPVHIDGSRGVVWLRDQAVEGDLVLPQSSFAIVQRFLPVIEAAPAPLAPGDIEGHLKVGGTLGSPLVTGGFTVDGAAFSLRDMEEVYRDVHAVGKFEGTTLTLTELRGSTGPQGRVTGTGKVELKNWVLDSFTYNVDLVRVPVYSLPEVNAIVNGHLEIKSQRVVAGRPPVPDIHGNLVIVEARITQEFTSNASGSNALIDTDAPPWLATIPGLTLQAEDGNVRLDNSLVDAELAGTLVVRRTRQRLDFVGTIRIKRGRYLDYLHYFTIKEGNLEFGQFPGFNPQLDVRGETGRPGQRIYVTLTGTALQPELRFSSESAAVSAEDAERSAIGPQDDVYGPGAAYLGTRALQETRKLAQGVPIVKELDRLRDISIDPGQSQSNDPTNPTTQNANRFSNLSLNLSAGLPLSDRLYLIYTHGVGSDIQERVAVELGLSQRLLLEAKYERRSITEGGTDQSQNAFDLDFKFRHEY